MTLTQTEIFIYGSVLICIGWLIGHRLAIGRDQRNYDRAAIDQFRSVISAQKAILATTLSFKEEEFFISSLPVIGEAVYKLRHILPASRWAAMNQIWEEYKAQDKSSFGTGLARAKAAFEGLPSHAQRLNVFLDRIYDAA